MIVADFTVVQCSIPLMAIKPFVEAMAATSEELNLLKSGLDA
nr:hypothetical protein Iba_chr14aCG1790 [Ipomoea batatas]GMD91812.1 hypothetical protein Iba_chr14eCG3020 [Ipomoea batatas]